MIYATLLAPILLSYSLQTPRGPVVDHTGKPLTPTDANIKMADGGDPLLLRAARGGIRSAFRLSLPFLCQLKQKIENCEQSRALLQCPPGPR